MSSAKQGLRRVGIGGLSVLVGASTAAALGFAAPANAATLGLTAGSTPNVTQGASNQAAGDLTYGFTNDFTTNATVTFKVGSNDCSTQANIDKAIGFASTPTVTITKDSSSDTTSRIPSDTVALGSSSAQCATAGVKDEVTVTLTQPSSPSPSAAQLDLNVTGIAYNVGANTPTGAVSVNATSTGITPGTPAPGVSASNANVVNKSFTFIPKMSATPSQTGAALGTAKFVESTAGAYFPAGQVTKVALYLSAGTFTNGVTPTITVPSGYTVYKDNGTTTGTPTTSGSSASYAFYVKAPATAVAATVTVAGLEADAPGTEETVTLHANTNTPANGPFAGQTTLGDEIPALNVVDQSRIGGSDRYATAAALFNDGPGYNSCGGGPLGFGGGGSAVVSGGELFPDALSANFLAGKEDTGTLLTRANKLSQPARAALQNSCIGRVFITGGDTAVSQAVQNEIESMHVNGISILPTIQVIRLGGADRYATNAKVNRYELNNNGQSDTAILAAGTAPYDSLAVGPIVWKQNYPLVLTNGSNLNHGEEGQFKDFGVKNVIIVGGPSVVSQAVQNQLVTDGYNVSRIAGATRYETAAKIATWGSVGLDLNGDGDTADTNEGSQGLTSSTTAITNGLGFADALAGGPYAGDSTEPLLLAKDANTVGSALATYLDTKGVDGTAVGTTEVNELLALGLNAATSNSMMKDAAADIGYHK